MTNQGNETELKRALEEGNLITVGQKSIKLSLNIISPSESILGNH